MKNIFLGSDHAGFELKTQIVKFLTDKGYVVVDCGPESYDPDDDYPVYISKVASHISKNPESRGIVLGKSGQGEAMVANRFAHVRAVVYYGGPQEIIALSRQHNDANVLSLGAGFLSFEEVTKMITLWLDTPFSNEERHIRRIKEIDKTL